MSQRVTVNHSRILSVLLGTAQLATFMALTSCTGQPAPASASAFEVQTLRSGPDAMHKVLSGGPGSAASQPYRAQAAKTTAAGQLPQSAAAEPAEVGPVTETPLTSPQRTNPPTDVVGHSLSDVRRTLGDPADQRVSGGTQTWIYRQRGCLLELTLFYDVSSGDYVVLSQRASPADMTNGCIRRNGG